MSARLNPKWYRVTRKRRCAVCDHPDWCTYTENAACCMRVESDIPARNGGWVHHFNSPLPVYRPPLRVVEPQVDCAGLWKRWQSSTDFHVVDGLAESLGVTFESLQSVGCAWNGSAFAFPMKNAQQEIIGIRLRGIDGSKFAVRGSKSGLFIPADIEKRLQG